MPLSASIRISFRQEPSYFAGLPIRGDSVDTIVARNDDTGELVGLGSRAERKVYMNGSLATVGYLCGLRIREDCRNGSVLARGFSKLRSLHDTGNASYYLTTIIEDNEPALKLLTSQRAGLPIYRDMGRYVTLIFRPWVKTRPASVPGVQLRWAASKKMVAGSALAGIIAGFLLARLMATRKPT